LRFPAFEGDDEDMLVLGAVQTIGFLGGCTVVEGTMDYKKLCKPRRISAKLALRCQSIDRFNSQLPTANELPRPNVSGQLKQIQGPVVAKNNDFVRGVPARSGAKPQEYRVFGMRLPGIKPSVDQTIQSPIHGCSREIGWKSIDSDEVGSIGG
jgi:hypothetical protein